MLLALLGLGVGAYGTLVGVGGGFVVVPLLLLVYKLAPAAAAATSLVVVFLNAASGSVSYLRAGRVDVRTGIVLALATVPGALVGPFIAERIPERAFKIFFGVFLIAMSTLLFLRPERQVRAATARPNGFGHVHRSFTDRAGTAFEYSYSLPLALTLSLVVGILSSTLGIGGGVVHVPALIHLMSFPVHIATATSQFVLAVTALAGVSEYARRDLVVWPLALAIGAGVILGAQIGAHLSRRIRGRGIVRLLTVAVIVLAGRLLWSGIAG
ncbi:MAG TPA: sulfite exporter TauE/SafE family protein [Gemmatimonadaceae bacterium]|nr:sulfite exporter TauE/SafE family protein [Gemmatimonadaceae bacterium]